MSRAYSLDLRERVVASMRGGVSSYEAAERYQVSQSSAQRWFNRAQAQGSPAALPCSMPSSAKAYNSLANITTLVIDIDMSMGTYDSQLGEYDLDGFGGNESINYSCFGTVSLQLQFDNSNYAQSWALNPSQAQDALTRNGGSRSVIAESTIVLTGVNPSGPGEPLILAGDVKKVRVIGADNKAPLGEYTVSSQ